MAIKANCSDIFADKPCSPAIVELEISLGTAQNQLTRMGLYIIDDIEHSGPPNTITIRGKAILKLGLMY
jgi:phage protein D